MVNMKAIILAAGRGQRMQNLTDNLPKVLLPIAGKPLIQYHIEALKLAGIKEIVINLSYRGEQIQQCLGGGENFGVRIDYSPEPPGALETAGGIYRALPLLGKDPFIVVNGDVWTSYSFVSLLQQPQTKGAHLVLVKNPEHNLQGDFALSDQKVLADGDARYTYAGFGAYHPDFFREVPQAVCRLKPLLDRSIADGEVTGEYFCGDWLDVGTPERYQELQARFVGT